jgi:hypothetical protein
MRMARVLKSVMLKLLPLTCREFYLGQKLVQFHPIEVAPCEYHGLNTTRIADVGQRIRVQQHKIGPTAGYDLAGRGLDAEIAGGIDRRRLQGRQRCHTTTDHRSKFVMYAKTGNHRVAASQNADTCLGHVFGDNGPDFGSLPQCPSDSGGI